MKKTIFVAIAAAAMLVSCGAKMSPEATKAWNDYKDAYTSQKKLESFLSGFNIPDLKEGEEYEIPVRKKPQNKKE